MIATNQLGVANFATKLESSGLQLVAVDGVQTSSGEFILLLRMTTAQRVHKIGLVKLSATGSLLWSKELTGGSNSNIPHYVSIT